MNSNMGSIDRILRIMFAVTIGILYLTGQISGLAAILLGAISLIFIMTSSIGFCPLYLLFKFSTKQSQPATKEGKV